MFDRTIPIDDVMPGDQVVITDGSRANVINGEVYVRDDEWCVDAFRTSIVIARTKTNGRPKIQPGVRLIGHTPQLITAPH